MKMAKVSPVYEGKIRGGREEDEEEEAGRSRMARENAKARIRNIRRASVRARRPYQRRMVTRSMASMSSSSPPPPPPAAAVPLDTIKEDKQEEEDHQAMNNNNKGKEEVVELNEKEKQEVIVIDEKEREKEKQEVFVIDKKQEVIVIDVDEIEDKPQAEAEAEAEVPAVPGDGGLSQEYSWPNGWYDGLDEWPMMWSYEEEWLWSGRGLGFGLNNPQWEYIDGVGWIDKRP